jgi:pimeloyl-ACP methyl ester carboxylesterase
MTEFQHGYADLGDVKLHYVTAGSGNAVVLLHGIPQTWHAWRQVIPLLAKDFFVVAPDLRGLGDSSRPARGYDKKTLAADIWRLVRDELRIEQFYLAGHDWGGPVAYALAAQHPEAVRRLAILDVVVPGIGPDFSQAGRRWHHGFFQALDLPEALCAGREAALLGWFFDHYGALPGCIAQADRDEYLRTYTRPGALRAMFEFYRALPADAEHNRALLARGKLKMPVLALGGDRSYGRALEPLESMKAVAENVRGGVVPGCGHWLAEEAPEAVGRELLKFFAEGEGVAITDHPVPI